ncbi:hypothetical protein BHE74_00038067 [Ensete ventricosum]|nr:hypothetical protein BHE74_00038067 [Ensete ventricosum]
MALASASAAASSSSFATNPQRFSSSKSHPSPKPPFPLSFNIRTSRCRAICSSSASSPFTEAHSAVRYQRDSWIYEPASSSPFSTQRHSSSVDDRENDIALQLPELKKLLEALRAARQAGGCGGGSARPGSVALVGTGPGDPDLLTLKAVRAIEKADLILYDRLVSNDVLGLVRADARLLYVERKWIFYSNKESVSRFLTGHSRNGGTDPLYVAESAADPESTLVVYMGLSTLSALSSKLINHGLPPNTPAVAVERGTTPQQRMVFSKLNNLANEVRLAELVSPTLIIIGKVVSLSPFWPQSSEEAVISSKEDAEIGIASSFS